MSLPTRVMGIDTGIAIVGWSVIEKNPKFANKPKLIGYGAITTDSKQPTNERLAVIYKELTEKIEEYNPHVVAVESLFYFKNQKTVIGVSQARGVILLASEHSGRPTFDYTPLQVKTAVTGYGRADKQQVQKMVKLIYGLAEVPKPDDVADAIAVATCHINSH
ncbi:crossover junction endodeoxyribonuclease RuvC [Candidatus Dojkabacteria bacterium]|uniref:Crossover junction endodeoxyribonuclease RuvC n=1 Tax=Candidatus Dojkabacteria bacterium TaxID=2099670 RepID=A0A955RGI7_9BACT|nr:crossover junction endodeoxyribonuclease RuvC [Candidatus Dojkabacteria bacterium]